jgi:hypothetical protein
MKQTRLALALLGMSLGSAGVLHAQSTTPVVTKIDPSKLNLASVLQELEKTTVTADADAPAPLQVVVQFLQLSPDQAQKLAGLIEARQTTVSPLFQAIQAHEVQLEALLNAGGNLPGIGALVTQIHDLQVQVARAQQGFLTDFGNLLTADQLQLLQAVQIAAQLQPVLPAFQQFSLF